MKRRVIPSEAKDLAHAAWTTYWNERDLSSCGRSLASIGMTRLFIFCISDELLRHSDLATNAAAFDGALVHRLGENRRHRKVAAIR